MVSMMALIAAGLLQDGPFGDCHALMEIDGKTVSAPAPWLADAIAAGALPKADAGQIGGVVCARDSIVPLADDEAVLSRLALPLYINAGGRVGALEASGGQLSFRVIEGQLSPEERPAVMTFLNTAQNAGQGEAVPDRP